MGNFDFVKQTLPSVYEECARAESHLLNDPVAACVYARRAAEQVVRYLYEILKLDAPYDSDFAARSNAPAFRKVVGDGIVNKLNLIRKVGNKGAHPGNRIVPMEARDVLTATYDVMIWTAFRYSPKPELVPTRAQFDPALPKKAAPLSRQEIAQLLAKFQSQDEAHAQALAEKDARAQELEAEIARLREQIAQAQAAKTVTDDHDYSEAETRMKLIDLLLRESGWSLSDPRDREYKVTGMPVPPSKAGVGYVDYVLWGADGKPLALVEAKRTSRSAHDGQLQAKLYADCLEKEFNRRPVIFYTNGHEHWIWDDAAGYPPRAVQGFYTSDELELVIQRRASQKPLSTATVDPDIAGRDYQVHAIKAVGDVFDQKQRAALLVMATGTGKTRVAIATVDQLLKHNWAKRILFLADRKALVRQANGKFKELLPSSAPINLLDEKSTQGRVYLSTYPTMMGLINEITDGIRRFGPGHFDLIIIDEAHRSIYQKYTAIFDWFDARLLGLTATPKDEVDHNTYRLFNLEDGVPTDAYDLEQAVKDGWLVPYAGIAAGTKFTTHGIKYDDLSQEEKDQWDSLDWGDDYDDPPTEVDSEELNRFLFNEDTVDKVLAHLMEKGHKVAGGDRLGKTIIFAKNQKHAEFIQRRFDIAYPQYGGTFAQTITHSMSYAETAIENFQTAGSEPHIAISVDMLDTGIDVPEVVNLVFFKSVRSKTKFWQMMGRGTRLCPDLFGPGRDKQNFLVFDVCGNLEYFSLDPKGTEGSDQKSLTQRIFEARLGLVSALANSGSEEELREDTKRWLHDYVAAMNTDNFIVRAQHKWVDKYADPEAWAMLGNDEAEEILKHLAGLPSMLKDSDEDAKRFDLLVLSRQLAQLDGDAAAAERHREQVQALTIALLSKTAIPSVREQIELIEEVSGDEWWVDVTLPMLETARRRLRSLIRLVEKTKRNPVYTDFEDELNEETGIDLDGTTPGIDLKRFREKAAAYLRDHEDHVALQRLRRNKQLTEDDIAALETMLVSSGVGEQSEINAAAQDADGLGLFIRSLVGLDRDAVREAFSRYLSETAFNVHQVRFVQLIIEELTSNGVMEADRLFESPYTDHAPTGPSELFPDADLADIVNILGEVKKHARPAEAAG